MLRLCASLSQLFFKVLSAMPLNISEERRYIIRLMDLVGEKEYVIDGHYTN